MKLMDLVKQMQDWAVLCRENASKFRSGDAGWLLWTNRAEDAERFRDQLEAALREQAAAFEQRPDDWEAAAYDMAVWDGRRQCARDLLSKSKEGASE